MLINKVSEYPAKQLEFLGPIKKPRNGCSVRFKSLDLYTPPELVFIPEEGPHFTGNLTSNQLSPVLFRLYEKALELRDGGRPPDQDPELAQWNRDYASSTDKDISQYSETAFKRYQGQLRIAETRFHFAFSVANQILAVQEHLRILQCLASRYSLEMSEHPDSSRQALGADQQEGEYSLLMGAFHIRSVLYWNWRHNQWRKAQVRKFSDAEDQEFAQRILQLKAEHPKQPLYWCAEQLQAELDLAERESTSPQRLLDRTRIARARLKSGR
jgi:hypothetical protein